jgi:hypothetical protein
VGAVLAAGLAAKLTFESAKAAAIVMGKLPKPVLVAGALATLAALLHEPSRRWIFERIDRAVEIGGDIAVGFYDALMPVVAEHYAAKLAADEALAIFNELLTDAGVPATAVLNAKVRVAAPRKRRATRKRAERRKPATMKVTTPDPKHLCDEQSPKKATTRPSSASRSSLQSQGN